VDGCENALLCNVDDGVCIDAFPCNRAEDEDVDGEKDKGSVDKDLVGVTRT